MTRGRGGRYRMCYLAAECWRGMTDGRSPGRPKPAAYARHLDFAGRAACQAAPEAPPMHAAPTLGRPAAQPRSAAAALGGERAAHAAARL